MFAPCTFPEGGIKNYPSLLVGLARKKKNSKKNRVSRTKVQISFRIEVKQNYSRRPAELVGTGRFEVSKDQGGSSYFNILSEIASFFSPQALNLYSRVRKTEDKEYYAFIVSARGPGPRDSAKIFLSFSFIFF